MGKLFELERHVPNLLDFPIRHRNPIKTRHQLLAISIKWCSTGSSTSTALRYRQSGVQESSWATFPPKRRFPCKLSFQTATTTNGTGHQHHSRTKTRKLSIFSNEFIYFFQLHLLFVCVYSLCVFVFESLFTTLINSLQLICTKICYRRFVS